MTTIEQIEQESKKNNDGVHAFHATLDRIAIAVQEALSQETSSSWKVEFKKSRGEKRRVRFLSCSTNDQKIRLALCVSKKHITVANAFCKENLKWLPFLERENVLNFHKSLSFKKSISSRSLASKVILDLIPIQEKLCLQIDDVRKRTSSLNKTA